MNVIDVLAKYANILGLGRKTGISLPREVDGLIPTRAWKKKKLNADWALGETVSCMIGQSYVLTTPLQLSLAMSLLANGGTLYRPAIISEVYTQDGSIKKFNSEVRTQSKIKKNTFEIVKAGLFEVVNHPKGTAYRSRGQGILMAGKSGTSQVVSMSSELLFQKCDKKEYKFRNHGVFAAYAPANAPKVAIAVVAEHQCGGSVGAAPIVKNVLTAYMNKYWPYIVKENKKIEARTARRYQRMKAIRDTGD